MGTRTGALHSVSTSPLAFTGAWTSFAPFQPQNHRFPALPISASLPPPRPPHRKHHRTTCLLGCWGGEGSRAIATSPFTGTEGHQVERESLRQGPHKFCGQRGVFLFLSSANLCPLKHRQRRPSAASSGCSYRRLSGCARALSQL